MNAAVTAEAKDEDKEYRFVFTDAYTLHVSGRGVYTGKYIRSTDD